MARTQIEWTRDGFVWNPWHGCCEIAPECGRHFSGEGDVCYAAKGDSRNMHPEHIGTAIGGKWTGLITRGSDAVWAGPDMWNRRKPGSFVFTCSMSDFFHEDVPLPMFAEALDVIERNDRLTFLVLTKRPGNVIRKLRAVGRLHLPSNVWLGCTIGHIKSLPLLKPMRRIEATRKFLSNEPLLTSLVPGLDLANIDWCITGGQSGARALPCNPDHVRAIRDLCIERGVAFFHKQWGTWSSNPTPRSQELAPAHVKGGATLDGRLWQEFP